MVCFRCPLVCLTRRQPLSLPLSACGPHYLVVVCLLCAVAFFFVCVCVPLLFFCLRHAKDSFPLFRVLLLGRLSLLLLALGPHVLRPFVIFSCAVAGLCPLCSAIKASQDFFANDKTKDIAKETKALEARLGTIRVRLRTT